MLEKLKLLFSYNKEKYENILDDPNSKVGSFLDTIILSLVILFPFVLTFESIWNNSAIYIKEIYIFDAVISIVFAFEYLYRFIRSRKKWTFLITPMRIIDLLSFLPFFLGFFAAWWFLKVLRILRALRVLRLVKRIPLTAWFIKSLKDYLDEYRAVFTLYLVILFLGSFFVFYVEKDLNSEQFASIPHALWWGLVTTTTVWYWDISPITPMWKAIWSVLVFLWPLLWWLISAVTIMVFMETSNNSDKEKHIRWKICHRCKTKNQKDSNFCTKCWFDFSTNIEHSVITDNRL